MQITMIHSKRGSEDGFTVTLFKQGETYDVADALARTFIHQKTAIASQYADEHDGTPCTNPKWAEIFGTPEDAEVINSMQEAI